MKEIVENIITWKYILLLLLFCYKGTAQYDWGFTSGVVGSSLYSFDGDIDVSKNKFLPGIYGSVFRVRRYKSGLEVSSGLGIMYSRSQSNEFKTKTVLGNRLFGTESGTLISEALKIIVPIKFCIPIIGENTMLTPGISFGFHAIREVSSHTFDTTYYANRQHGTIAYSPPRTDERYRERPYPFLEPMVSVGIQTNISSSENGVVALTIDVGSSIFGSLDYLRLRQAYLTAGIIWTRDSRSKFADEDFESDSHRAEENPIH